MKPFGRISGAIDRWRNKRALDKIDFCKTMSVDDACVVLGDIFGLTVEDVRRRLPQLSDLNGFVKFARLPSINDAFYLIPDGFEITDNDHMPPWNWTINLYGIITIPNDEGKYGEGVAITVNILSKAFSQDEDGPENFVGQIFRRSDYKAPPSGARNQVQAINDISEATGMSPGDIISKIPQLDPNSDVYEPNDSITLDYDKFGKTLLVYSFLREDYYYVIDLETQGVHSRIDSILGKRRGIKKALSLPSLESRIVSKLRRFRQKIEGALGQAT